MSRKFPGAEVRLSHQRIFLIFLLIRYTGAKLNEVPALDHFQALDQQPRLAVLGKDEEALVRQTGEVQTPETLYPWPNPPCPVLETLL